MLFGWIKVEIVVLLVVPYAQELSSKFDVRRMNCSV